MVKYISKLQYDWSNFGALNPFDLLVKYILKLQCHWSNLGALNPFSFIGQLDLTFTVHWSNLGALNPCKLFFWYLRKKIRGRSHIFSGLLARKAALKDARKAARPPT